MALTWVKTLTCCLVRVHRPAMRTLHRHAGELLTYTASRDTRLGPTMEDTIDSDASASTDESLTDRAYRRVRDAIIRVELRPGDPLDARDLSATYGLGLTPIRDALKRLTLEKLAVTYPRRGTFVSRVEITDEAQLTEIRLELEGLAAALAAQRATPSQREELLRLITALEAGGHQRSDHTELDAAVHRAIYAAARNAYLEASLTVHANLAMRIWNVCLQHRPVSPQHVCSQREVVDAIVGGNAPEARRAARRHLQTFSDDVRSSIHSTPS